MLVASAAESGASLFVVEEDGVESGVVVGKCEKDGAVASLIPVPTAVASGVGKAGCETKPCPPTDDAPVLIADGSATPATNAAAGAVVAAEAIGVTGAAVCVAVADAGAVAATGLL